MAFGEGTGKEMRKDVAFYEKAKKIRKEKCQSRV